MNNQDKISKLLSEACQAHHDTFKQTGGVDVDWSLWYAKWLYENPSTLQVLGSNVTESKLAYALLALDIDYTAEKPDKDWHDFYSLNIEKYLSKEVSN